MKNDVGFISNKESWIPPSCILPHILDLYEYKNIWVLCIEMTWIHDKSMVCKKYTQSEENNPSSPLKKVFLRMCKAQNVLLNIE